MTSTNRQLAERFAQRTGIHFRNPALLAQALTHSRESGASLDYQRLEFLGDRVLGLVIAEELLRRYPEENGGRLARRLNQLVRRETCAEVARNLRLHELMRTARTAERGQVQASQKVLADLCESVIAAIYLDQGLEVARSYIMSLWEPLFARYAEPATDAKSALQEWAAARGLPVPTYREVGRSGPDHAPRFEVEVSIEGLGAATGTGPGKRVAEQEAAAKLLQKAKSDRNA
jgi:ribonuclease-3